MYVSRFWLFQQLFARKLKPELIWSLLGEFWKILIKIKQLKSSMTVLLSQKLRVVECLGNSCGYVVRYYNFWTKSTINLIKFIIESYHEHVDTYKLHSYSTSLSKVTVCFISQHFLWSQYTIPLKALEPYRLIADSSHFPKIPYTTFQNFVATSSALQKWRAALNF